MIGRSRVEFSLGVLIRLPLLSIFDMINGFLPASGILPLHVHVEERARKGR